MGGKDHFAFEEFENVTDEDFEAIRSQLAERPYSWLCVMCDEVFGPEVRAFRTGDATTPELLQLLANDQALCGHCVLRLTGPIPNDPRGPGDGPS